jgi:hypothetical protein
MKFQIATKFGGDESFRVDGSSVFSARLEGQSPTQAKKGPGD